MKHEKKKKWIVMKAFLPAAEIEDFYQSKENIPNVYLEYYVYSRLLLCNWFVWLQWLH